MTTSSLLRPEVGAPGLFSRAVPGPTSAPRRGPVAVARLGTLGTRGCRGVSLRAAPLVRGRVAVGFTAPRAIASDKIPKRADEPSEVEEKTSSNPDPADAPKPPSAVIDVQSMTSTASNDDPEAASDGGDGGGSGDDRGSGGGGGGEGSGDAGRPGQPELPPSMVALATWAVSQTKDWSAAADGGLRAAFGTLVGVNCITVMLVRAMRGRSERRRRARDEKKRAAIEARNVAAHEEELAALSRRRDAEKNAAVAEKEVVVGAGGTNPAFPPARRDPGEVLNSMGRRPEPAAAGGAAAATAAGAAAPTTVPSVDGFDTDEAEDFLVRALESYDGVDALEGLPDAPPAGVSLSAAERGVQSRTSPRSPSPGADFSSPPTLAGEDVLAFALIPDDARDPRVVTALGDVARAQAAAADAFRAAGVATARAADATDAAQRLQRAIAAGASEEELNAISAQAAAAANGAAAAAGKAATREGADLLLRENGAGVGRAAKVAVGGVAAAAGAVARGVSIATPVVVDGARRYVPAAADAVGRGAKTVWDGDEVEGKRRPGLKQRAGEFFAKFKRRGGEDGGETAAPAV
jgi:hypothetical protein